MKALKFYTLCCLIVAAFFLIACGGGGSGESNSGTISMSITDAKPLLPLEDVTNLFITFSGVSVHSSEEGWIPLSLPEGQDTYTIDLLQFHSGETTQFVPPAEINQGHYTQVRIEVTSATIRLGYDGDGNPIDVPIKIPSDKLRTDKNFEFVIDGDQAAMNITIHFDLSQSIVVTGNDTYKLKPVMHLFTEDGPPVTQASKISGSICNSAFYADPLDAATLKNVVITVIADNNGETYTQVVVEKSDVDPTDFTIYWIPPNQNYTINFNRTDDANTSIGQESVVYDELNGGFEIILGTIGLNAIDECDSEPVPVPETVE